MDLSKSLKDFDKIHKLKIISYNIKSCDLCTINQLIDFFKKSNYDFILLQEVDNLTKKNNYKKTELIANAIGYYYYFSSARKKMGGEFGNSILSKHRIYERIKFCLPDKKLENRCIQGVKILINDLNIWLFNTHLDWDKTFQIQNNQINNIYKLLGNYDIKSLIILGGDFNIEKNLIKNKDFLNEYDKQENTVFTWSSKRPKSQIDNIFIKNNLNIINYKYSSINTIYSDHKPLICEINLK